jgi:hypothetical protein
VLLATLLTLALQNAPCRGDAARHVTEALRLGETFNLDGAARAYGEAAKAGCAAAEKVAIYVRGLIAARAADAQFGSAASLQPLRQAIGALEPYAALDPVAGIMQAVLRAAMPAAQHERAEMALLIDEMLRRESLQLEARLPAVPVVSAHEAAGYFWLQLHVYDEANRAFELAEQRLGATSHVLLGAARAAAGQRDVPVACIRYTRFMSWWATRTGAPPEINEARTYLTQPQCVIPVGRGRRP